ncbi:phage portal protein [Anaerotignum lactatifermentans]|uniref:Phage portal protein n=1 Tax=Anaerotignum lactatifermentans TaxID=160404 RepID=A0ABS2G6K5_9FIRM|nr:phage portal protein [Anaerotignum lactatifermentans]MBM6828764.1 phage portal protein [Anaerotignum lactatifermentans]MBM6877091.1 phage portal protein [Anaerotignum lactatifermentans]MBM6950346.1 phage portal protein [Anaerotignum lactatifermentans]
MEQSIFLKEKALPMGEKEILISGRFQEEGRELPWRIRAMSQKENVEIQNSRMWREKEYLAEVIAACVVFPDLKDAALQDSYGVLGAGRLLEKMLTAGEFAMLQEAVEEING